MAEAIKKSDPQANILAYNWQREASSLLNVPAEMVPAVARDLATELTTLATVTGGLGHLNLVGHSLGAAAIARVAGDPALQFSPLNTSFARLTLFDAPQQISSALLSGRVVLDQFIATAKTKFDVVENFFGGGLGAFGVNYVGIANTLLQNAVHGFDGPPYSPQGWYLRTMDPSLVSPLLNERSQAALVGINETPASLLSRYGQTWSNGVLAPDRGMFLLSPPIGTGLVGPTANSTPVSLIYIGDPFTPETPAFPFHLDCAVWRSAGSTTCAQGTGLTLITHSPTWAFTNITIPTNIDAMSVFFRPGLWGPGDAFVMGINDHLIYSLTSDFFTNNLFSTGELDLSGWWGQDVTLSFGFISDFADHWLSVERIQFFSSQSQAVSEPSTLVLIGATLLGLISIWGTGGPRRTKKPGVRS